VAIQNAQVPVGKLAAFMLAHLLQLGQFLSEQTEFGLLVLRLP
jgi:hypothetical protein